MSLKNNSFQFGHFVFDAEEGVLSRDGKPMPVPPRALKLLSVLVENSGRIVEKQELMRRVWEDAFVEEGNITYTIRLLRKTLADERQSPRYIETVPKRGYRFIAEINEVGVTSNNGHSTIEQPVPTSPRDEIVVNRTALLAGLSLILIATLTTGVWYVLHRTNVDDLPIFQASFKLLPLSTDGRSPFAVLSQDGKEIVYVKDIGGKEEVWLRHLDSSNNVQIIPPTDDRYFGLALSPDGDFLYFSRRPRADDGQTDIYRISIFGGAPKTVAKEAQGWISLSPDGNRLSFVRCYYLADENCSLWLGDSADGGNEKKLVSRSMPSRIAGNSISPDGKQIAFAVGQSENSANEFGLNEVDIGSGTEREITPEKFFNIKNIQWLADGRDLLITARKNTDAVYRIWRVSATSGEARPITNDGTDYSALSIDRNGDEIVSTKVRRDSRLRLYSLSGHNFGPDVIDAESLSFSPDGRLYFSSRMTGNDEIWSSNSDGTDKRQLTVNDGNNDGDDAVPIVSPDNSFIFFTSNRTGRAEIWRMRTDGGDQTQITFRVGGYPRWMSPDGAWLYYRTAVNSALWRVRTTGGGEEPVVDKSEGTFRISPDGKFLAYLRKAADRQELVIDSMADGKTVRTFRINGNSGSPEVAWYADGASVVYVSTDGEQEERIAWRQKLDGGEPEKITNFGTERVADLAISPDGSTLAVAEGDWKYDAALITGLR